MQIVLKKLSHIYYNIRGPSERMKSVQGLGPSGCRTRDERVWAPVIFSLDCSYCSPEVE